MGEYVPKEIEMTPAMIEAGTRALQDWWDGTRVFNEGARTVYVAMRVRDAAKSV